MVAPNERIRTLLVEDNLSYARLLEQALRSAKTARFEVTILASLAETVRELSARQPDLIILDLSLPDSHGLPTFLNVQDAAPGVPVVVLTGLDDDEMSAQVMNAGAQDYVVKGEVGEALITRTALHAYERHRLQTADKERILELQALFRIATILSGPGDLRDNAAEVLDTLIQTVGADRAVLRRVDSTGHSLINIASAGPLLPIHPPAAMFRPDPESVTGRVLATGQVIIENHHVPGGRTGRSFPGDATRSTIGLPITDGTQLTAILHVASRRTDFFHPGKIAVLTAMARSLGVLISNAELREHLAVEHALNERKDSFISIASHELRTPMTMMLGLSELLLDGEPPEDERRSWYSTINRETKRLATILDDMLDVSKIQAGSVRLDIEPVTIQQVAADVVADLAPQAIHHKLSVEVDGPIPQVLADSDKVSQVLRNLLDNAVKYSPNGGPVTVTFQHKRAAGVVVMSVRDHGMGIAPADRKRLFTTFARGTQPELVAIRGTGLGLYIVRSLLDMMNGRIWLTSRRGKGTTFSVALPAAPDVAQPMAAA
jgi:signal transduction histidine kinase/DNA-binding response OmpR family regulator